MISARFKLDRIAERAVPCRKIVPYLAGVVQWQDLSFPSSRRGFDSHRPLQGSTHTVLQWKRYRRRSRRFDPSLEPPRRPWQNSRSCGRSSRSFPKSEYSSVSAFFSRHLPSSSFSTAILVLIVVSIRFSYCSGQILIPVRHRRGSEQFLIVLGFHNDFFGRERT